MNNLGQRVKDKRKELNLTQLEMAKLVGVSHVTISQWEHGENTPRGHNLNFLCKILECNPDWLLYGAGPEAKLNKNIPPIFNRVKFGYEIPLISWEMAYKWPDIKAIIDYSDFRDWRHISVQIGNHGFAIVMEGDSMTNPTGFPSIPQGSVVIIDPDLQPKNSQIVLARLLKYEEATLKKYVTDGPNQYLVPLNPSYKTIEIDSNCSIIGVVLKVELDFI